ncbi:LysR family transcriptional regulator [Paraurantiacibacter namhicola]|uniref:HTH-type transcriptional activator CmpR n=1 Tax=Paraurantiacibacter namhicola TaxID=645517 RepID=A0A1C7D4Q6_9SPHN|nr:LysR family transcriptional regulator [Paraurantiacibacter namhicola]ANU06440.1 HTH-type transcriptional activator CmpR [Paraurantiacibacter namhicola]
MRAFVAVGQLESFKLAARELLRTQPAVSLAISQLEDSVGVKLLERTTRKVLLTTEGEHFMPVAARLIRDFDAALSDLNATSERRSGHVSLAVLPSVATRLLPEVCRQFSEEFPGISVHMIDDNSRGIEQRLARNEVDFGIGGRSPGRSDLDYRLLLEDRIELICHRDHPLAQEQGPIEWAQLYGQRFLDSGLHNLTKAQDLIGKTQYEFSTTTLLFAMLKANFGVTVLPSLAAQNADPVLVSRPLIEPEDTRAIYLITKKGWSLSPAGEAMIETILQIIPAMIRRLELENVEVRFSDADFKDLITFPTGAAPGG